jgi:ABC-type branched-subunit amino acid transport system substrate-binding protein
VHFSPANTSPDFTDYEDNGLYFRTAPSDLLQGEVLGNLIAEDGASTLGLLVLNDPYGTGLAAATQEAFEAAGGEVVVEELFNTGDSSFDAQLSAINAANPDAVALITFDESRIIVPALVGGGYPGDQLYFVDGNLFDYSADFAPGLIAGSKGTLPGPKLEDDFRERLLEVDPALADFSYGPESYDATMLIALAAYAANSTEGADIAEYLRQVSGGSGDGEKVSTFADAAALLAEGQQVDFDGPSGPITLDENGDPTEATIGIYEFGEDNKYTRIN